MRVVIHAHVTFAHRFQERTLRFRSSTVDLIRQHDVGENRSAAEFRRNVQSKPRDSAWARVVFPTPGTSSISR